MKTYRFLRGAAQQRREELGLSIRAAAEHAGISPGYLSYLEAGRGQPSAPTYMRICMALDIDPDALREPYTPEGSAA